MSSGSFPNTTDTLRHLIAEVMEVETITLNGDQRETIRAAGRLLEPAHEAFARLRPRFEETGHTPFMRREDDQDVILAVRQVFKPEATSPWPNLGLLMLTLLSTLYVGAQYGLEGLPTIENLIGSLPSGLMFAASMLGILGAHEMGHYLMARRHGVRVTLPYFIPLPTLLGTMGAVIAMQEPSPNRRVQFDIGVAGPVAGLVVAIPILIAGLLMSEVMTWEEIQARVQADFATREEAAIEESSPLSSSIRRMLYGDEEPEPAMGLEGNSLFYLGVKYAVFGKVLPSTGGESGPVLAAGKAILGQVDFRPGSEDVSLHVVAWAGWAGLLVTALNLLPVGQLDGGHVLYGLVGDRAQVLRWPLIILLLALGLSGFYDGWLLWAALIYFLARRSAPVLDEITTLDNPRRWIAIVMLAIFVLLFVPVPLQAIPLF